jgi:hypothetical protein
MDALTGKKIGPLEEIKDPLDTAATAYYAEWAPDSSRVAITYRADRHIAVTIVYRIANRRAYLVTEADRRAANALADGDRGSRRCPRQKASTRSDDDRHVLPSQQERHHCGVGQDRFLRRGNGYLSDRAKRFVRLPSGHPLTFNFSAAPGSGFPGRLLTNFAVAEEGNDMPERKRLTLVTDSEAGGTIAGRRGGDVSALGPLHRLRAACTLLREIEKHMAHDLFHQSQMFPDGKAFDIWRRRR